MSAFSPRMAQPGPGVGHVPITRLRGVLMAERSDEQGQVTVEWGNTYPTSLRADEKDVRVYAAASEAEARERAGGSVGLVCRTVTVGPWLPADQRSWPGEEGA